MANGQVTTLTKANNSSASLRTTVPAGIIKQLELGEGDSISWKLEARNDDLVLVVVPVDR